jgi:hypothetical protein
MMWRGRIIDLILNGDKHFDPANSKISKSIEGYKRKTARKSGGFYILIKAPHSIACQERKIRLMVNGTI